MWRLVLLLILSVVSTVWAAESSYDSYEHATECPENGQTYEDNNTVDGNAFVRCQCTSYVSSKLSALFTARYYNNGAPADLKRSFQNLGYYMPQSSRQWPDGPNQGGVVNRWSHALYWRDAAIFAGIGVTGARDNFTWDEHSYNAVFPGDVAWWDSWNQTSGRYGHVAYVESAEQDVVGRGVACVWLTEYNWDPRHTFNRRRVCKTDTGHSFPDAFLHIDRDHSYCTANRTKDNCSALWGSQMIASSGSKADGLGGSSDPFNLKLNHFWTRDIATGLDIDSDTGSVRTGQAIAVRMQIKAKDGDTHDHMRDGKDTIELDFYAREDLGEWFFLKREYIQATNLPNDATHTEHVDYVVPAGVTEVSFKVKVDAEDEASESNEGDNWSPIITLPVNNNPTYDLTVISVSLTTTQPVSVGGLMGARMGIRNLGNATPPMAGKACYEIQGPSTNNLWQTIADDTLDEGTLVPGFDWWEEIISLVRAPTVPGGYTLRATANCTGTIPETDMTNNSLAIPFDVVPPRPDFIVRAVGPAGGSASIKAGSRFYPAMYVRNVGTAASPSAIRSAYWFMGPGTGNAWVYITDDGTEASRLCVGCEEREQYDGGMKISVRGTYYFRGCADYEGVVTESNEANNCTVSSPITVY